MILSPRRTNYRKWHKMRIKQINYSKGGCKLQYGRYGIRALKSTRFNVEQIEAARRVIAKRLKKKAKIWIRMFPNFPITAKPKEVRMGKGKGTVDYWVDAVSSGRVLFELNKVSLQIARQVFEKLAKKMPIPIAFISKSRSRTR